ncbi:hypothetical protein NDU88_000115 [Pleurodeles waltl]|uniref:Uncharacterized protein n=1 Tax=Pleurodeles waltl TaxID=8319 RepID=A0AAV7L908_PLEWA|nr:hypothetical protein NDU88_000115 [Pleurodeles waltl]
MKNTSTRCVRDQRDVLGCRSHPSCNHGNGRHPRSHPLALEAASVKHSNSDPRQKRNLQREASGGRERTQSALKPGRGPRTT